MPVLPLTRPSSTAAVAVGLAAGIMSGLFGVGGGVVLVPALTGVLGMSQHRAHATSLAAIILTAAAGVVGFALQGSVDLVAGGLVAAGAMAGAVVGARVMADVSARGLRAAFAVLMLAVAVQLLVGASPEATGSALLSGWGWYVAVGGASGMLSALMGVGGGVVIVPALVLLFGFSQPVAQGTSLAIIVPTAIAGSLQHGRSGLTDWRTGAIVGAGGVAGALGGSQVALLIDPGALQRLFALLLVVVGGQMLLETVRSGRDRG